MSVFVEEVLIQLLLDAPAVQRIAGDRIYPDWVDEVQPRPYVTVIRIDADHVHHMEGASGVVLARIQIDAWGTDRPTAALLYDAIRNRLDGFRGTVTTDDGTLTLSKCFMTTDNMAFVGPAPATERGVYRESMDFETASKESIPSLT